MSIKIDYDKCCWHDGKCASCGCGHGNDSCNGCVEICPVQAITRGDKVAVDAEKCIDCGACVAVCPKGAITLE
ncbi:MAG: 4Fe-4S binding protein [Candidatus Falkowbacteria bacterium]